jgi:UDP-glucose 4-epimerase
MKRLLLIGGTSFVARNIIKFFSEGFEIKTVSRTSSGHPNEINIKDFFLLQASDFQGFDIVINCAAIVHKPDITDPEIYDRINFQLAIFIAELAKSAGVKQFLQLSTIAVYGTVDSISINSQEFPVNPYGLSKLKADRTLLTLACDSFVVICIRPPMIYGGGDAPGNMIRLISLIDKKIPLPFGNAVSNRDFISIHTLVKYCLKSLEINESKVYLIKDFYSTTTKDLALIISSKLNIKPFFFSVPTFLLSILKKVKPTIFEKLFGQLIITPNLEDSTFSSKEDLSKGISEMIDFYKKSKIKN